MFQPTAYTGTLEENYALLIRQLTSLLDGETDQIANLANAAALLNQFLTDINWVGFYLLHPDDVLVLGPFQGLPACTRIPVGKGVCGTSAARKQTIRVDDVSQFPGHIACDAASRSEIVVPMMKDGKVIGVLDIDSPKLARFSDTDQRCLEQFVHALVLSLQTA